MAEKQSEPEETHHTAKSTDNQAKPVIDIRSEVNTTNLDMTIAWMTNPHPNVGNNSSPIDVEQAAYDCASMSGSKGQFYTTYNCTERSILVGLCHRTKGTDVNGNINNTLIEELENEVVIIDDPMRVITMYTEEMTSQEKQKVMNGALVLISPELNKLVFKVNAQREKTRIEREIITAANFISSLDMEDNNEQQSSVTTRSKTKNVTKDPTQVGYYYYSDMIPVRSVAVTRWRKLEDANINPPLTPYFESINERLADSNPTTALFTNLRGPSIRDSSSIAAVARSLKHGSESFKEVAAITRLLCMGISNDVAAYRIDNTIFKFIRRFIPNNHMINTRIVTPTWSKPDGKILAVPLDVAISIGVNKLNNDAPAPYDYAGMDVEWTMVPIRQAALNNGYAGFYIASFLDSAYWNGTVNWTREGSWSDNNWEKNQLGRQIFMPNINSVRIPGPIHILLVLLDSTSGSSPNMVTIPGSGGALDVPVWWQGRNVAPVSWRDYWNRMWTNDRRAQIPYHCSGAYNEICSTLGVADTCGLALNIAAELYLSNHPGIAMSVDDTNRNYAPEANGAYAFGGGPIDKKGGKNITAKPWVTPTDKLPSTESQRKKLCGFNFGIQTPWHFHPTSMARITYVTISATKDNNTWVDDMTVTWNNNGHDTEIESDFPRYRIYTCSSMMRLAITCGLVDTRSQGYRFKSGPALANFVNMVGCATGLSVSNFLVSSDINVRSWVGWDSIDRMTLLTEKYNKYVNIGTNTEASWVDMTALTGSVTNWAWNEISEYYGIDPINEISWCGNSNWPIHAFLQWMNKLNLAPNTPNLNLENYVTAGGRYIMGVKLTQDLQQYKPLSCGTIDFHNYSPQVWSEVIASNASYENMWIEQYSYQSSYLINRHGEPQYYASTVYGRSITNKDLFTPYANRVFVIDSRMSHRGDANRLLHVTPIMHPDPPDSGSFLRILTDYVMFPFFSGLAAYLASGGSPIAAAGGAVGSIIHSAQKDKTKSEIRHQIEEKQKTPLKIEVVDQHKEQDQLRSGAEESLPNTL